MKAELRKIANELREEEAKEEYKLDDLQFRVNYALTVTQQKLLEKRDRVAWAKIRLWGIAPYSNIMIVNCCPNFFFLSYPV